MSLALFTLADASISEVKTTAAATTAPPKRRQTAALPDQIQAPEAR